MNDNSHIINMVSLIPSVVTRLLYLKGSDTPNKRSTEIAVIVILFTKSNKLPIAKTRTSRRKLSLPKTSIRESTVIMEPTRKPVKKSETDKLMNKKDDGVLKSFLGFLNRAYNTVEFPIHVRIVLTRQNNEVVINAL